jgi:hypothetical protein
VTPDTRKQLNLVGESFDRWYKAEIEAYVARTAPPANVSDEEWAETVVRNVSQFTMGRLVSELVAVGVSLERVIAFLRKNVKP